MSLLDRLFGSRRKRPTPEIPKGLSDSSGAVSTGTSYKGKEPIAHSASGGYAALDQLLAQVEAEVLANRKMPIRRLRRKLEFGGREQVIAWSYTDHQGENLDLKAAEQFLSPRLASIGLGLSGSATWTRDDGGCSLAFWSIGNAKFSTAPSQFRGDTERIERLGSEQQRQEAARLVKEGNFQLLFSWLCEAKYQTIPAEELRNCVDAELGKSVIGLLQNTSSDLRKRGVNALGPLGGVEAAKALCASLSNAEPVEYWRIADALERIAGQVQWVH